MLESINLYFSLGGLIICTALFLCGLCSRLGYSRELLLVHLLTIVFSLVFAFRPMEIPDTINYERYFYSVYNLSLNDVLDMLTLFGRRVYMGMEGGFLFVTWILAFITLGSFRLYLFIIAFTQITCFIYPMSRLINESFFDVPFKYHHRPSNNSIFSTELLLLLLYIPYYGYFYCGIVIRMGLTLSLIVTALYLGKKKRYIYMVAVSLAALMIHRMALLGIVAIIIYLVPFDIKSRKTYVVYGGVCAAIYCAGLYIDIFGTIGATLGEILRNTFFSDLTSYIDRALIGGGERAVALKRLWDILWFFILVFASGFNTKGYRSFLKIYFVGLILMLITAPISNSERITAYFFICQVPLVYMALEQGFVLFSMKKRGRIIFAIAYSMGAFLIVYRNIQYALNFL